MERGRTFDASERVEVGRALLTAEELTAGFYRIAGREWGRFPYDVVTLADEPAPPVPAFADVVRLVSVARNRPPRELYRIRVRDDRVLDAVHGRSDGVELFPLMLYVLTHELVHVVRFGGGLAGFDAPADARDEEERRVHDVTRKILRPVAVAAMRPVLGAYRDAAGSADGSSPKYAKSDR